MDIQTLRQFVPFNGLQEEYLQEALEKVEVHEFAKGHMLFKRGRAVSTQYFLLDGQVDLIDSNYFVTKKLSDMGDVQGALNPESPTPCSGVAKSGVVRVFSIEAETLDRLTAWSQSAASQSFDDQAQNTGEFEVEELHNATGGGDWMSSLLQAPLFSKIPLTQVQELFLRFEDIELEQGELLFKEGSRGDYFYVLVSGEARVFDRSGTVDLAIKPGHFFGEESLLGDTPRNASVEVTTAAKLKRLNTDDFNALLRAPVVRYVENKVLERMEKPYKLLDVKMPMEFRIQHMPGAINIPLSRLRGSLQELGAASVYVVPDDAGSRADIAAHLLCQAGYDAVILKNSANEYACEAC